MRYARLALGVLLLAHAPVYAQLCRTIDFNTDASGASISPATVITDQYEDWGVSLSYVAPDGPLFTFDSTNTTGNDIDLGVPNENCTTAGPGIGSGTNAGEFNCFIGEGDGRVPGGGLGNLLIIQDDKNNPPLTVPDDSASGGTITFEFERDMIVRQILFVDDIEGTTRLFDVNDSEIGTLSYGTTADNGYYPYFLPVPNIGVGESFSGTNIGVRKLEVGLLASGAIAGVEFCEIHEFAVPASSPWSLTLMAALISLLGVAAFRRRV